MSNTNCYIPVCSYLSPRRFRNSMDRYKLITKQRESVGKHSLMKTHLYVFGDIDNVRQRIERELFAENLPGLSDISKKLANEIAALAEFGRNTFDAQVIVAAGDEILLRLARDNYSLSALETARENFTLRTGCTISFGVAYDIADAYLNLRRAKASGGGAIIGDGI